MAIAHKRRRLKITDGVLTLLAPGLPELSCLLVEADDKGCLGRFSLQTLSPETGLAWRQALVPQRPVTARLECAEVPPFESDSFINHLMDRLTYTEIELDFGELPAEVKSVLARKAFSHAMNSFELPIKAPVPPSQKVPLSPAVEMAEVGPASSSQKTVIEPAPAFAQDSAPSAPQSPPPPPTTTPISAEMAAAADHDFLRSKRLGEVLIHMGHCTPEEIQQASRAANRTGEKLGRYLLRQGIITPRILCHALALQSGLPMTDVRDAEAPEDLINVFSITRMQELRFIPFDQARNFVCIAVADVLDRNVLRDLEDLCGRRIQMFLADEEMLVLRIDQILQQRNPRKHARYPLSVPVVYQFCNRMGQPLEETVYFVTSVNVSRGGLAVQGVPTALGTLADTRRQDLYTHAIIKTSPHEIEAICQIRWVRKGERRAGAQPRWSIGLMIVEITPENQARLDAICQ
ncbi:MAG TPA: PilZ domain-containing protein [Planctomycetota bacterium]|nr:PilZ domain-containing protein [Planctomycetota bacterium]